MKSPSRQPENCESRAIAHHSRSSGPASFPAAVQPVQGYFVHPDYSYRVANDWSVAVNQESNLGGQEVGAKAGMISAANQKLKSEGSGIKFIKRAGFTLTEEKPVMPPSNGPTLKKRAKESQVQTVDHNYDIVGVKKDFTLPQDCGEACKEVTGKPQLSMMMSNRSMLIDESPNVIKAKLFAKVFGDKIDGEAFGKALSEYEEATTVFLKYFEKFKTYDEDQRKPGSDGYNERLEMEKPRIEKEKALTAIYQSEYNKDPEQYDKLLGINKSAVPEIGQGFVITRGGDKREGAEKAIAFHYAGVVMKSADGKDLVTLENMAQGLKGERNQEWWFQMYGTESETFHEDVGMQNDSTFGTEPQTFVVG
jgi:hypothetical protein